MTTIGEIGEDALIALFAPRLPETDAEILGPGDDAAVVAVDGHLVVSSDVLVEGRHFRREWSTGADVGWRAAMQNLADIDAMGAVPTSLQITLCAPSDLDVDWVLDFADGLREACEPHGVGVVGGDLSGADQIVVSVTVLGETHGTEVVTRADAHPGMVVAVSAPLGAAAAGFALLDAGVDAVPEASQLFKRPRPIVGAGLEAALRGAAAMMDISDGLLRDAGRIARASEVGIALDSAAVPVHPAATSAAAALGVDALRFALTGGEDHALLAVFPSVSSVPPGWEVIGEATDAFAGVRVDGQVPDAVGWDHFSR
ncbi:thiamine-phosphate kinase [Demequina zhanjiangensis]|uniref:Thiamine-monophosphate kinase n=1 Tax=Demequina zhanjiangensis TaxID=3051659 RepID=A0ABT8G4T9_9MICO|nr:thiamine-phosphate kinase [Demequina sp. SYSU T00b26]MDN4474156.1 thiamine-phosphate kinase [Demequina sp. SYSU T00b26]